MGEVEAKELEMVPFALRQCKEVTDAAGVIHRYPIKTRRLDMAEGLSLIHILVSLGVVALSSPGRLDCTSLCQNGKDGGDMLNACLLYTSRCV